MKENVLRGHQARKIADGVGGGRVGVRLMRSTSGIVFDDGDGSSSSDEHEGDMGKKMFHGIYRGMSLQGMQDRKVERELELKEAARMEG